MALRKLSDINEVKKIVEEYKLNTKPTLSGLARALGIHPDTLYRNSDRDDEIGDILVDTYLWLIQKHEEALWDSKNYVSHIFWLKCLKKHMTFKENVDSEKIDKIHFTYEVVDKTNDNKNS
jgi:hypothetical protein